MIHMPRRSVTRFFIPLIDVLLLLFCIFLLMPMVAEEQHEIDEAKRKAVVDRLSTRVRDLERKLDDLSKLEELRPELEKLEKLRAERDLLRKLTTAAVHEKVFVRILDIDGKTVQPPKGLSSERSMSLIEETRSCLTCCPVRNRSNSSSRG